jgi:hypothetical protein
MLNLMRTVWSKAVAVGVRFCSLIALLVLKFSRAVGDTLRRRGSSSVCWLPPMGQQLLDTAVQLRGHAREHILEVPSAS